MTVQRSRLPLLIGLIVLIGVGMVWRLSSANREAMPGRMDEVELRLTKAWDGEVVAVPGALTIRPWMKKTREYKRILNRGFASDLTATDLDGNTYVAHALGRQRNDAGRYFVCFSSMEKRRPDGSLENVTLLAGDAEPFEWTIMDERGNRTIHVMKGNAGSYTVAFFENGEAKFVKEWEVDPELNIYSEQVRSEDGHYHFTHRMR